MRVRARIIDAALTVAVLTVTAVLAPGSAAAASAATASSGSADTAVQQTVDSAVAAAAEAGIEQSVAVVDRATGERLADSGGTTPYISESIVKLFTVAYYEHKADGRLDGQTAGTLRSMIINSDDRIESSLWNTDIVPSAAAAYELPNTRNGPKTGPHDWGWELITADDEADFLYRMSKDPEVAPLLLPAMADVAPSGADGFDQSFGLNALTGDHGSKQGWTDVGSTPQVQVHSVGWTDRYFIAILQSSTTAGYDAMRAAATTTAKALQDTGNRPSADSAARAEPAARADPKVQAELDAELAAALDGVRGDILAALRTLVAGTG